MVWPAISKPSKRKNMRHLPGDMINSFKRQLRLKRLLIELLEERPLMRWPFPWKRKRSNQRRNNSTQRLKRKPETSIKFKLLPQPENNQEQSTRSEEMSLLLCWEPSRKPRSSSNNWKQVDSFNWMSTFSHKSRNTKKNSIRPYPRKRDSTVLLIPFSSPCKTVLSTLTKVLLINSSK